MGFSVARVTLQCGSPTRLPGESNLRGINSGGCQQRRSILDHGILRKTKLHQKPGHHLQHRRDRLLLLVRSSSLQQPNYENIRGRHREVELQCVEHVLLHGQHLVTRIGIVWDVHEVVHFGSPDFFILRSQEHGGDSHELQILPGDALDAEVSIDQVGRQKQRLRHKLEFEVHFDEPVNQNGAHFLVDVRLTRHVICWHATLNLRLTVETINIFNVLNHCQLVARVVLVDVRHRLLCLVHLSIIHTSCNLRDGGRRVSDLNVEITRLPLTRWSDMLVNCYPRSWSWLPTSLRSVRVAVRVCSFSFFTTLERACAFKRAGLPAW